MATTDQESSEAMRVPLMALSVALLAWVSLAASAATDRSEAPATPPNPKETTSSQPEIVRVDGPVTVKVQDAPASEVEVQGLEVQRRMATASEQMVTSAYWQLAAGALGSLLLLVTLVMTVRTTRAASASVEAANRSADAAKRSADSFKDSHRAWVTCGGVVGGKMRNMYAGQWRVDAFRFEISWVNSGATPALNVGIESSVRVIGPTDSTDELKFQMQYVDPMKATIGPGRPAWGTPCVVDFSELMAILDSKRRLILWQAVEYEDIFSPGVRHQTEITYEVIFQATRDLMQDPHNEEAHLLYKVVGGRCGDLPEFTQAAAARNDHQS